MTVFSGLSALIIEEVEDGGEVIRVRASTRDESAACPGCGTLTGRVHGYHDRTAADVPVDGRRVLVKGLWGTLWGAVTFGGACQFSRTIFRSRSKFARPYMSRLRYLSLQFLPSRAPLLCGRASPAVTACWSRRMPRAKE